ncbi:MAG: M20/M25/M40 family metallo-hydrolase [Desulfatiglandaceae bacterium]
MESVFRYIEENKERFIEEVLELVSQPSISARNEGLEECAELLKDRMEKMGISTNLIHSGGPPYLFGEVKSPGAKVTVLFYGHYDVQPPDPLELWKSPPFEPQLRDGRIFGRGSSDNKGQLWAIMKAVEAVRQVKGKLPLNVKFLLDGEEEIGSPHLEGFIRRNKQLLEAEVGIVADAAIHSTGQPALVFGRRGMLKVEIRIKMANRDLHSGLFGGVVPNAAWRMVQLLDSFVDKRKRILVEGFYDNILPLSPLEEEALKKIPVDEAGVLADWGLNSLDKEKDVSFYHSIMFRPTFNINGLESGYTGHGSQPIVPCTATAKVDIRLVSNQHPMDIYQKLLNHIRRRKSDEAEIELITAIKPSKIPLDHPYAKPIVKAITRGFGEPPVLIPVCGGTDPDYLFMEILGIPRFMVPFGNPDENSHAPNENLSIDCFMKGIKTVAASLYELNRIN